MPISKMLKWTCNGCDKGQPCTMYGVAKPICPYHTGENMELSSVMVAPPKLEEGNSSTSNNTERDEIFECLDRLQYCSPKSESWISANAKFIRELIQKLPPVS